MADTGPELETLVDTSYKEWDNEIISLVVIIQQEIFHGVPRHDTAWFLALETRLVTKRTPLSPPVYKADLCCSTFQSSSQHIIYTTICAYTLLP